jgi:hypothetical protein
MAWGNVNSVTTIIVEITLCADVMQSSFIVQERVPEQDLKIKAASFSEALLPIYETTQRQIRKAIILIFHFEKLKSHKVF